MVAVTARCEFELAEALWDAASPCLTADVEAALCVALHCGEPVTVILRVLQNLAHAGHPIPRRLLVELDEYLSARAQLGIRESPVMAQVQLRLYAAQLRASDELVDIGVFGDAALTHVILEDAGVVGGTREQWIAAIRAWLAEHRPRPALRVDLRARGFGDLLTEGDMSARS